MRTIEE